MSGWRSKLDFFFSSGGSRPSRPSIGRHQSSPDLVVVAWAFGSFLYMNETLSLSPHSIECARGYTREEKSQPDPFETTVGQQNNSCHRTIGHRSTELQHRSRQSMRRSVFRRHSSRCVVPDRGSGVLVQTQPLSNCERIEHMGWHKAC